ncbi:MAG: lipoprotein [Acidimicrobiales bacterium]|nr:lipoprotein [Acidimicrobiales bacterium]
MRRPAPLLPLGERRVAAEALLGVAAALALLAKIHGLAGLGVVGLAFLLAGSLLLVVQAPAGSVPLGYALIIALAELASPDVYFPVLGVALLAIVPVLATRYGQGDALRRVARWLVAGAACGGAEIAADVFLGGTSADATLLHIVIAGTVFLGADLVLRGALPTASSPAMRLSESWPVQASLLCAAALLAVGYRQDGRWMAVVAVLPLVMTRFAFDRYAAAQQAYRQTIKALSIVPEVAGVTPLGHGERSAVYAVALARELGLASDAIDRVATAARLHHIGYVTVDDPQEAAYVGNRVLLARLGGDILRQTQFLANVGDLVESVHAENAARSTREGAVLRVASGFDHLVLEDPERANGAVQLLAFEQNDPCGDAAVLALRQVLDKDLDLVNRAVASAAPLTEAAASSKASHG